MLQSLIIVLGNVLHGFQSSLSSSNFDLVFFFSSFKFFTLSHIYEMQTTLMLQSPLFPTLVSLGQTRLGGASGPALPLGLCFHVLSIHVPLGLLSTTLPRIVWYPDMKHQHQLEAC